MSKETLKANLREIPDFPIPGILFLRCDNPVQKPRMLAGNTRYSIRDVQGQRHHQSSRN